MPITPPATDSDGSNDSSDDAGHAACQAFPQKSLLLSAEAGDGLAKLRIKSSKRCVCLKACAPPSLLAGRVASAGGATCMPAHIS